MRSEQIGIVGLGYVGLPLAIHFAQKNAKVLGFDIDISRINQLSKGDSPIPDVSSSKLLQFLDSDHLCFSSDPNKLSECQIIIICVPTPLKSSGEIELTALEGAADLVTEYAPSGALIINESTSFPGTLREVFQTRLKAKRGNEVFYLATAPERVDPGSHFAFEDIPRVVGGIDTLSSEKAVNFYSQFFKNVHQVATPEVAEMSKLLENTFRQVNISLVNEINELCQRVGIDTREVIAAAATKPYGFMKFLPSAGIGGHCIPVDPEYLQYFASRSGERLKVVSAASAVNDEMGESIVRRVVRHLGGSNPLSALILGVAYKPNIPDIRDTPAEAILQALNSQAVSVDWHDPLVEQWNGKKSSSLKDGSWEVGIVVTAHDLLDIELAKTKCNKIFDCTGRYSHIPEIVQI
jgi:UDP-N-acetyl-D-glucosamine dehydrogenase